MQSQPANDGGKKPYGTPRLVHFGRVEDLTGMQQSLGLREEVFVGIPTDGRPFAS